jgi:hypothetical protein
MTTGRINQVDIIPKYRNRKSTVSNVCTSATVTHARKNSKPATATNTLLLSSIDSIVPSLEKTKQPIE